MSRDINGPLVPVDGTEDRHWGLVVALPSIKSCPDCGEDLTIESAHFYGGVVSGVTWYLTCLHCKGRFSWQAATSYEEEAYG